MSEGELRVIRREVDCWASLECTYGGRVCYTQYAPCITMGRILADAGNTVHIETSFHLSSIGRFDQHIRPTRREDKTRQVVPRTNQVITSKGGSG